MKLFFWKKSNKAESVQHHSHSVHENKEAVDETIRELHEEKKAKSQKKRSIFLTVLFYVFFPITLLALLIMKISKKVKIPITVKMLILFSIVFLLILLIFIFFFIGSVTSQLSGTEGFSKFLNNLKLNSAILAIIFTVVFMALIAVASTIMLNPIRKISDSIDEYSSENLSARLEIIDTQDEMMELTHRINGMLDNLQESFERQQNFVADASHELKTPIAVIQGYSNLLKRWGTQDPEILSEGIENICRESDNMKRIVEQLLLLARLGKMSMNKSVFNICEVLDDMVEGYKIVNTTHMISFWGEEEILVDTDKNLFLESVRTLVDNAIKYTPAGGEVKVQCKLNGAAASISVRDTGVGISQDDISKVFDRFFRCDKARGRETGSSGLGLTIAKSIVEMMGGEITVESELNKGSCFTITLY